MRKKQSSVAILLAGLVITSLLSGGCSLPEKDLEERTNLGWRRTWNSETGKEEDLSVHMDRVKEMEAERAAAREEREKAMDDGPHYWWE